MLLVQKQHCLLTKRYPHTPLYTPIYLLRRNTFVIPKNPEGSWSPRPFARLPLAIGSSTTPAYASLPNVSPLSQMS